MKIAFAKNLCVSVRFANKIESAGATTIILRRKHVSNHKVGRNQTEFVGTTTAVKVVLILFE
ncbi:hypothetical protein [Leptospira noguchii]|uniref:hypothetical protein n=1 Tax=Leptospira noguchii TaxID=28182 RepID=UPI00103A2D9C|nr:hypothetical protein [Leptospira noguchii]